MNEKEKILTGQVCPYCNCETFLVSGKEIYGQNSAFEGMYYRCIENFDHYVGTYKDNITSLGRLADKELRGYKMDGHSVFDPMWKTGPKIFSNQQKAYRWLSKQMNIPLQETHFGMFTIEQCKEAISKCKEYKQKSSGTIL